MQNKTTKTTKNLHDGHRKRLRDKFKLSKESFAQHELLELLLGYAIPRKDTNALAHDLINKFGSLSEVLNADPNLLMQVDGIGENAASLLSLVGYVSSVKSAKRREKVKLSTIEQVKDFATPLFEGSDHELLFMLFLDAQKNLVGYTMLDDGSKNSVSLNFETFSKDVLIYKPKSVVLVHNHFADYPYPSQDDDKATAKIFAFLNTCKVNLYDHVIIGNKDAYSYFYDNRLQRIKETVSEKFL
ncbi:MAG: RadC family protein [Clostridia bacterium]|nr:RadC family protein [Clostridia bacterium]